MKAGWTLVLLFWSAVAAAQPDEVVRAALYLTGAASAEELDERLLEEMDGFRQRPLRINGLSKARLLESGLLTPYQVAALEEYRSMSGDVLSFSELERVDGFGKEAVDILRPFLSLESSRPPGSPAEDTSRFRHSALFRTSPGNTGGKYRFSVGRLEAAAALKGKGGTAYALWRTRRGKVLVGDYNIRYGQGLAFWTAFQLSGLSTPSAFSKRGNGITPSWSFSGTGTLRGIAWDGTTGPFRLALFGALDGTAGAHAEWMGRNGQAGISLSRDRISIDGKAGVRGIDLFGEGALRNGTMACLAGCRIPSGRFEIVTQLRAVPSAFSGKKNGEYGAAAGLGFRPEDRSATVTWTVDASLLPIPGRDPGRKQVKSIAQASWTVSSQWLWEPRLTVRWRNYEENRAEFRTDLTWKYGPWSVKNRLHAVVAGKWGYLGYLEGGWRPESASAWIRATIFSTPDWVTRIYTYERDAPGSFTVPAYYGTGVAVSAYGGWKKRFRKDTIRLYFRISGVWKKQKPGQAGLRFQLAWDR